MTFAAVLDELPSPGQRRIAVRVTRAALRKARRGHPWIFDGSVTHVSHQGAPGDVAVVFDDERRFVAVGLWDPNSPIRVRVLAHGDPLPIDADLWRRRIETAVGRRHGILPPGTDGYRVVHGESDGFGGLVVDRYADTVVVKVYSAGWFPHLTDVIRALVAEVGPERVVLRLSRNVRSAAPEGLGDGLVVYGPPVGGAVEFREGGLTFTADVVRGQKTGYFLDQRDNRLLVAGRADGARILDVFSCSGGFGVHAAAAGATAVHAVDRSPHALSDASANFVRNATRGAAGSCAFSTECGDAFEVLASHAERGDRWDVVVIDPPSFASRADLRGRALDAYGRLARLGARVVADGGLLVQASCSSRVGADEFAARVHDAVRTTGRRFGEVARTAEPADHPADFAEGRYLKATYLRFDA